MSTYNNGLYEEMAKSIFQLLSNIIKYALYLFFSGKLTVVDPKGIVSVDTRAVKTGKYMSTIKTISR